VNIITPSDPKITNEKRKKLEKEERLKSEKKKKEVD